MALDGKRQWERNCTGCLKMNWEGLRYECNRIVLCPDCYPLRHELKLKGLMTFLTVHLAAALKFPLEWRTREPFLINDEFDAFRAADVGAFHHVANLVEQGKVRPNDFCSRKKTLFWHAISSGNINLVKYLAEKGGQDRPPYMGQPTWRTNSMQMMRFVAEELKIPICRNELVGLTIEPFDWEYVTESADVHWLLDHGFDANGNEGAPPLFSVTTVDAAKALISRGADVHATDNDGDSVIFAAVRFNSKDLIDYYASLGVNICHKNLAGCTALHHAVSIYGNLATVQYLVEKGCNPRDISWTDRETLLFPAMQSGDVRIVQFLLDQGVNPNHKSRGLTCLSQESLYKTGDWAMEIIKLLEKYGVGIRQMPSRSVYNSAQSALHLVCGARTEVTTEFLDFILSRVKNINIEDQEKNTPLLCCTYPRSSQVIIPWLIANGADIHHINKAGENVLFTLAKHYKKESFGSLLNNEFKDVKWRDSFYRDDPLSFLIRRCSAKDPNLHRIKACLDRVPNYNFHKSTRKDNLFIAHGGDPHINVIKFLLSKGLDINALSESTGETLLTICGSFGSLPVIEFILEQGADPTICSWRGSTPLMSHVFEGALHLGYLTELIKRGLDVHHVDNSNCNVLKNIVSAGNFEAAKYLIEELHVDFTLESVDNQENLLVLAVQSCNLRLIEYLVKKGLSVNSVQAQGRPISFAANHVEVLKLLVSLGADAKTKDYGENTILHQAVAHHLMHRTIVLIDYLLDVLKIDFEDENADGQTALDVLFMTQGERSEWGQKVALHLLHRGAMPSAQTLKDIVRTDNLELFKAAIKPIIKYLSEQSPPQPLLERLKSEHILQDTIAEGSLDIIRYLTEDLCPGFSWSTPSGCHLLAVIKTGRLDLLQYAISKGALNINRSNDRDNFNDRNRNNRSEDLDDDDNNNTDNDHAHNTKSPVDAAKVSAIATSLGHVKLLESALGWKLAEDKPQHRLFLGTAVTTLDPFTVRYVFDQVKASADPTDLLHFVSLLLETFDPNFDDIILSILRECSDLGVLISHPGAENLLWSASRGGHNIIVHFLIEMKIDPHVISGGVSILDACGQMNKTAATVPLLRYFMDQLQVKLPDAEAPMLIEKMIKRRDVAGLQFLVEEKGIPIPQGTLTTLFQLSNGSSDLALNKLEEIAMILVKNQDASCDDYSLDLAAEHGWLKYMQLCVDKGVSLKSQKGVLWRAVAGRSSQEVVEWCLKNGVNTAESDSTVFGPVYQACYFRKPRVLKQLLDHGIQIDESHTDAFFILGTSTANRPNDRSETCAEILISNTAPTILRNLRAPLCKYQGHTTPLIHAIASRRIQYAKMLLPYSDASVIAEQGATALHYAVMYSVSMKFLERIIAAAPEARSKSTEDGFTPYIFALRGPLLNCLHLLREPTTNDASS